MLLHIFIKIHYITSYIFHKGNNKPLKEPIEVMKMLKYKSTKNKSVTFFQDHLRDKEEEIMFHTFMRIS